MPRKKLKDQDAILSHNLIIRVSEELFRKLDKLYGESDCQSIGEVARKILSSEKINCFYRDVSIHAPMEEMALIRKELKAIGININQITRSFNQDKAETHRAFYVLKVADLYKKVDEKVDRLLIIISQLAEKWLQKS
jgi:negative regulator of replication initiation